MTWYKITLTDEQIAKNETAVLQQKFDQLWLSLGSRKDMTLFAEKSAGGPSRTFFLTPACYDYARALIGIYSAVPCEEPPSESLSLLLGHAPPP